MSKDFNLPRVWNDPSTPQKYKLLLNRRRALAQDVRLEWDAWIETPDPISEDLTDAVFALVDECDPEGKGQ